MESFKELSLSAELQKALQYMKFETPTPIQAQAIPPALEGKDVIGCAQTGTGKTAAFSIPLLTKLQANPQAHGLILTPTRELALQIVEVLGKMAHSLPQLRPVLLIGGQSMWAQSKALARNPRVIVATPGRLIDHLRRKSVKLRQVEMLVLDEADRMLDMGFLPQLNEILEDLPPQRQTLLFSATLAPHVRKLIHKYQKDPVSIVIGRVSTPAEKIAHETLETTVPKKQEALLDEINKREGTILVFARTKARTTKVAQYLEGFDLAVTFIHGDRSQGQRTAAIRGFRDGKYRILVATDVAARGLDIPHIAHVFNYDLPQCPEDFIHRIGRTGRAGAAGHALSFLTPEDRGQWRSISRLMSTGESDESAQPQYPAPGRLPQRRPSGRSQRPPRGEGGRSGGRFGFDGERRNRSENRFGGERGNHSERRFGDDRRDRSERRFDGERRNHSERRFDGERRERPERRFDGERKRPFENRFDGERKPRFQSRDDGFQSQSKFSESPSRQRRRERRSAQFQPAH